MVKGLAAFTDNEEVLLNEVNQLGLDDTQKELLLRRFTQSVKTLKAKPQQTQTKTPLEMAVDEHFDAKAITVNQVLCRQMLLINIKCQTSYCYASLPKRNNDIKIQKHRQKKQAKVDAFRLSPKQRKEKMFSVSN